MKTAVIYSGQARTFKQLFDNHWFHVLRKFPDVHVFCSVETDEQSQDMLRLRERLPSIHLETVEQPEQICPAADPLYLTCYPPSSSPSSILKMFWARQRAWEFFKEQTVDRPPFDIVVHLRPDIAFARFEVPECLAHAGESFNSWVGWGRDVCFTPWWGRYGGHNDRFAVMGVDAAEHYFSVYNSRQELRALGCPVHPELMLATTLELGGISPQAILAAETITVRLDGTTVGASISAIDYAEYARK